MARVLEVQGVSKRFLGLQALKGVSLGLEEGEILAVIGPNGAGKSTLLNVISGLLRPDSGRVLLLGEDVTHLPPEARTHRGLGRAEQRLVVALRAEVVNDREDRPATHVELCGQ